MNRLICEVYCFFVVCCWVRFGKVVGWLGLHCIGYMCVYIDFSG